MFYHLLSRQAHNELYSFYYNCNYISLLFPLPLVSYISQSSSQLAFYK